MLFIFFTVLLVYESVVFSVWLIKIAIFFCYFLRCSNLPFLFRLQKGHFSFLHAPIPLSLRIYFYFAKRIVILFCKFEILFKILWWVMILSQTVPYWFHPVARVTSFAEEYTFPVGIIHLFARRLFYNRVKTFLF